jgi:SNF2 family DNA or RNA helicase
MSLTAYHARYFAHELTKRSSSASIDSLTAALADAQVDLNPHQVEAALFAFRSPLSRGAILADEVGLGKTIEAGILLSQRWAERRRRLLVICPANLRKQWGQELADKFFLPYAILETKTFNEEVKRGNLNPFDQPKIILCSFQFARTKDAYVRQRAPIPTRKSKTLLTLYSSNAARTLPCHLPATPSYSAPPQWVDCPFGIGSKVDASPRTF